MPMFSEQDTQSVIEHMNEDHADAVLLYVKAFADPAEFENMDLLESAAMSTIDESGIDVLCQYGTTDRTIRINYKDTGAGERLESISGARKMLVDMVMNARKKLA